MTNQSVQMLLGCPNYRNRQHSLLYFVCDHIFRKRNSIFQTPVTPVLSGLREYGAGRCSGSFGWLNRTYCGFTLPNEQGINVKEA